MDSQNENKYDMISTSTANIKSTQGIL